MSTHDPHPHPGNPNDARWLPPNDQDIVQLVTKPDGNGSIIVYEPDADNPTPWIKTTDWHPLSDWE